MTQTVIASSVLILAILCVRFLFRDRLSQRARYALWGLVLARLLLPSGWLLPSEFSLLNAAQPVEEAVEARMDYPVYFRPVEKRPLTEENRSLPTAADGFAVMEGDAFTNDGRNGNGYLVRDDASQTVTKYQTMVLVEEVLTGIWQAGMVLVGGFFLVTNLLFWRNLRKKRRPYPVEGIDRRVFVVEEGLPSPCLFGLFSPAIYLTPEACGPERLGHVLAHEETHTRHLDHIWALLECFCLTLYWFHPLVWAAVILARRDSELACDEGAVARLGEAQRIPYGETLVSLIPVRAMPANPLLAATTMVSGKRALKDRVVRIARKPQKFLLATVLVGLLAAVLCACTFTAQTPPSAAPSPLPSVATAAPSPSLSPSPSASFSPSLSPSPSPALLPSPSPEPLPSATPVPIPEPVMTGRVRFERDQLDLLTWEDDWKDVGSDASYAVTDLDGNGRLEVLVAPVDGETAPSAWELDDFGESSPMLFSHRMVVKLGDLTPSEGGYPDLCHDALTYYEKDGRRSYVVSGSDASTEAKQALTLENGGVDLTLLATRTYHPEGHHGSSHHSEGGYSCYDHHSGRAITSQEYDGIEGYCFPDHDCHTAHLDWFHIPQDCTHEDLQRLLLDSWKGFTLE